jgi:hypothetical protein
LCGEAEAAAITATSAMVLIVLTLPDCAPGAAPAA